jgi:hypothetical protein
MLTWRWRFIKQYADAPERATLPGGTLVNASRGTGESCPAGGDAGRVRPWLVASLAR